MMRSVHFWRSGFVVLTLCLIGTESHTVEAQLLGSGLQPMAPVISARVARAQAASQQLPNSANGLEGEVFAPIQAPDDAISSAHGDLESLETSGEGCGPDGCTDDVCSILDPCPPPRCGRITLFGEYLYLRSRDTEVAYAVPIDGPITNVLGNGIQIGPTAVVNPTYDSGFRVGGSILLNDGSQVRLQWTNYETNQYDDAFIAAPDVLRSLVTHPLGNNTASDGLRASATLDIEFELLDVTYRAPLKCCPRFRAEYSVGIRYGTLDQDFQSQMTNNGTTTVATGIDFDGTGPTFGLGAERPVGCCGLYIYSRGDVAFLAGKTHAMYQQTDAFGLSQVNTSWESGRVVTQLEWELGMGWTTPGNRMRVSCGYLVNGWFNTVKTEEYINAVQTNSPDDLGDTVSFDGMTLRAEIRF